MFNEHRLRGGINRHFIHAGLFQILEYTKVENGFQIAERKPIEVPKDPSL